ncbi:uncharacterized protein VTP21DRAFT_9563 [Calcarisporiella thermophila]|uniref:uncharacterized protein n=1 Tax=Calcarisporiella thermophila TaxID=911321 RepID=UPI003742CCFC
MLFALIMFEVGNLICGAAPNMAALAIGRAIAGIGAGGITTMDVIIISDVVPIRDRGKYQGFNSSVLAVSSIIVSGLVLLYSLKLPAVKGSLSEKLRRIDWYGCDVLSVSLVGILLAISWGRNDYEWSSGPMLGTLIPGSIMLVVFIWIEMKVAVEPVISTHVFKHVTVSAALIYKVLFNGSFFGMFTYITVYLQMVKGASPTTAGLELIRMMFAVVVTSIIARFLTAFTGRYRFLLWIGTSITIVGMGLLTLLDENTTRAQEIGYLILVGAGDGLIMQPLITAAQSAVEYKAVSLVSALTQFFRATGNMIGIAIGSSVFNNSLVSILFSIKFVSS